MIDAFLLGGLCLFTCGMSFILYFLKIWEGGVWWGFFWAMVTFSVMVFEGLSVMVTGRTLTRHIKQWGKESERNKWIARGIVVSFAIGASLLMIHLWVF